MAKFVSKSSNLLVVLRPGIPGNILTGTHAVSGLSVRFRDGFADVKDEEIAELMMKHNGFNQDFILAEDERDPFSHTRSEVEPMHTITDMKYGMPAGRLQSKVKPQLSPEAMKYVEDLAQSRLKELLPEALSAILPAAVAEALKGAAGRAETVEAATPVAEDAVEADAPSAPKAPKKK